MPRVITISTPGSERSLFIDGFTLDTVQSAIIVLFCGNFTSNSPSVTAVISLLQLSSTRSLRIDGPSLERSRY